MLRTLMQSTPPVGGAIAAVLLVRSGVMATAIAMAAVMGVPGVLGLVSPALADEHTSVPRVAA